MSTESGKPDDSRKRAGIPAAESLRSRLRITPFAVLAVVMAGLAMLVAVAIMDLLAAGRAYVAGESHWSKAHHAAIFHLDRYAESGDAEQLLRAREKLRIPLSDRQARIEL